MRLLGLNGFARAGKDEVAAVLGRHGWARVAFADPMRRILEALDPIICADDAIGHGGNVEVDRLGAVLEWSGWDQAKENYPEVRRLLQKLGTEGGRQVLGENVWVDAGLREAERLLEDGAQGVVFTDVRFPNELEAIIDHGGQIAHVSRPGVGAVNGHISEDLAVEFHIGKRIPDWHIRNDGTLADLARAVEQLVA